MNVAEWTKDGQGDARLVGEGEFEVEVKTPLTLWCTADINGSLDLTFDCRLVTPNAKMLVMACARAWRGRPLIEVERAGRYDEYNSGDLELYSVGFNRSRSADGQIQRNAHTANVRRIGGPKFVRYAGVSAAGDLDEWLAWDQESLLVSVRERTSGSDRYYRHRMCFDAPKITYWLDEHELFTVVDHRPQPLVGGNFGFRCMTPGAVFRIKDLTVRAGGETVAD